ncbi:MAG: hypothetical protein COA38_14755, partial [Fluviicola sp.]
VLFFDASTSSPGTITDWSYDFGDGGTSSLQNSTHTYSANGTYAVCLTIVTSDSCTSTYCDTIVVNCLQQSTCDAFFQYTLGACPTVLFFDASTSSPGTITDWSYDFGDGGTSSLQNSTHTYTANGTYVACLTIVTSDSCTSTYCDTIQISCIAGIDDLNLLNLIVMPNPAQNEISLQLENASTVNYKIIMYNGKVVATGTRHSDTNHTFDISEFAKGAYFLEIEIDGTRHSAKFMKY